MNKKIGKTIWFTGLSGSGKSTLSCKVKTILEQRNVNVVLLDGDALRSGLNRDLGFSAEDRAENIRRAGETAKILTDAGHTVLAAFITPLETLRTAVRNLFDPGRYVEIYLDCSLNVCETRDPKGLYKKAREGRIPNFTGISSPFEIPRCPDLKISTDTDSPNESIDLILSFLEDRFPDVRRRVIPWTDKPAKKQRVAVIGLDGIPASLVFGKFRGKLPTLSRIMEHGVWGPLKSTDPPITIPAWSCITTGKDPGELGVYGFRNRSSYDYSKLVTADSNSINTRRVWDHVEESGGRSILIGIPQTFPAKEHMGITVAGFPASRSGLNFTYPAELSSKLDELGGGAYLEDIVDFRQKPLSELAEELRRMVDRRFNVASKLMISEPWDFFMLVEIAPDRAHHMFWRFFDPEHPRYEAHSKLANVIPDLYQHLDSRIAMLMSLMDDETTVVIISDHGAMPCHGGVCVNEWLIEHGYLHLNCDVNEICRLDTSMVDWSRTAVWSEGGYYGRIFLNVKGREPQGYIEQGNYEKFCNDLAGKLATMSLPGGESINNDVFRPGAIYADAQNVPPDLIVYFDGLRRRAVSSIGTGRIFVDGDGHALDDCNHDPFGIFLSVNMSDLRSGFKINKSVEGMSYKDVVPHILSRYGIQTSHRAAGVPIFSRDAFRFQSAATEELCKTTVSAPYESQIRQENGFSLEEQEIVRKRLEELGYI